MSFEVKALSEIKSQLTWSHYVMLSGNVQISSSEKELKTWLFKQSIYSHFPYYIHEQRKSGLCQMTYMYHDRKNFKAFLKNFSRTANRKILNSQHKQKLGLGQFLTEATKSHIKKCVEKFEIKSKQTTLNCCRIGHKFDFFFGFLLS